MSANVLFFLHKMHRKRNKPNDHCQIPQLSILWPSYISLSLLWQHFMWIIKCHRNVIAPSVQRYITIIIIPYKFNFFICGCQKLFKKVIIIILPLWQGKRDKGQAVPSSFRHLGSFCRQWRKTARQTHARRSELLFERDKSSLWLPPTQESPGALLSEN